MNYFNKKTNTVITDLELQQTIGNKTIQELLNLEIYPIEYNYIEYDRSQYYIEPDDHLEEDLANNRYIQNFHLVELSENEKNSFITLKELDVIRVQRNELLQLYDIKITQLQRQLRLTESDSEKQIILNKIEKWDQYAKALCDLPNHPDAPWLNKEIPWPVQPTV